MEKGKECDPMKNQIIITLGREHGSGGHYIADMIAHELASSSMTRTPSKGRSFPKATARK